MEYEIVIVRAGDDRYEPLLGALRADTGLRAQMWRQAEFELTEPAGKIWLFAVAPGGRLLAWCAIEAAAGPGGEVRCVDSCERPECWDEDVYGVLYEARRVLLGGLPAVTYVFAEPVELHEADGWRVTASGWSDAVPGLRRRWFEMRI